MKTLERQVVAPRRQLVTRPASRFAGGASGPPALLSPERVMSLQRSAGNSAVASLLGPATVQRRAPSTGSAATLSAELLQTPRLQAAVDNKPPLNQNERGDAVARLQQALDQVNFSPVGSKRPTGEFDGVWGNGTTQAVRRFQSANSVPPGGHEAGRRTLTALDRLLARSGPRPGPGPEPRPQPPGPDGLNPELEKILDYILMAHQDTLLEQLEGLVEFERDLQAPESGPRDPLERRVIKYALQIGVKLLWSTGSGALIKIAKEELPKVAKIPGIVETLKVMDKVGGKLADEYVANRLGQQPLALPDLVKFVNGQRHVIINNIKTVQEHFIENEKTELRKPPSQEHFPPPGPGEPLKDPRIQQANEVLNATRYMKAKAKDTQYLVTTKQWALAAAHQTHGARKAEGGADGVATDLRTARKGPGVFEIEIDPLNSGREQPNVKSVKVTGLSEKTRERMEKADIPLADLGARIVRAGSAGSSRLIIGRDEVGHTTLIGVSSSNAERLKAKHAASQGGFDIDATAYGGAVALVDEIESGPRNSLKKVPGGLSI